LEAIVLELLSEILHAGEDILAPAIQEKNCLRHRLHDSGSLNPNEIAAIKTNCNLSTNAITPWWKWQRLRGTREYAEKSMK
jgi:hypothetical protein